jgi:hypothetical protein
MTPSLACHAAGILTWEQACKRLGSAFSKAQWEMELETYHRWLERTPCGEFPTVIEGAWGIYQVTSAGREPVGYFLDPHEAERYAIACYGQAWEDEGRQLLDY